MPRSVLVCDRGTTALKSLGEAVVLSLLENTTLELLTITQLNPVPLKKN